MDEFIKKSLIATLALTIIISLVLVFMGQFRWAGGIFVSSIWSMLNFSLTINILKIAILKKDKKALTAMLLIKFPILYLSGFFILVSKYFPIYSLLVGIPLVLIITGVSKLWPKYRLNYRT